ncbi:hypothetical protein [Breznakiella homolactica]|uniref:PQQ-like beta-propeller repeat protein n=1 Tax=Breznakiella homolactica TaxID=2798577 RepID=A0A7T7XL81_9SPIR|nr:hypothetical protein [Breznakiella homolactica]QQO08416.1 hypothetical protein JFL75_15975 [Breznakiella homolactica]
MAADGRRKRNPLIIVLCVLLVIVIGVPLVCIGISFIGRISAESVIPDSFSAYLHIPNPVKLADNVLAHQPLPEILAEPAMASLLPVINQLEESGILQNSLFRFAARGSLDGALLPEERILAVWDAGIVSPFLRFLPSIVGRMTVPNLYYVQAGKLSRFEYRMDDGTVYFIGPYRNLLVIANNQKLFESVLDGTSRDGDIRGAEGKNFTSGNFDIALLVSSASILGNLADSDPAVGQILSQIQLPGLVEAAISFFPDKLDIALTLPLSSQNPAISGLIDRNSTTSALVQLLPDTTQYSTILSAGSLEDLVAAISSVSGPDFDRMLKTADNSSRMLLKVGIEELLFSWTGNELGVFGLEGRPDPVFAVKIGDENKRKEIFDRVFSSFLINENISVILDGTRIPQIRLPGFLDSLLRMMGATIPSPYYTVQNGYLFVSESPENLLSAVSSMRKNAVLPKTAAWKTLSQSGSDQNSFSLFYSLDRSLPFFLKGNTAADAVLKLYRQGLARMSVRNRTAMVTLSVIPGPGKGILAMPGYPLDLGGNAGKEVHGIFSEKKGESRLLLTRGTAALAVDPANNTILEFNDTHPVWNIPAEGIRTGTMADPAAWVVNSQGIVTLVNGNMQPMEGFPLITGCRPSAPPAAFGGKLFLPDGDGSLYTVDARGTISELPLPFREALRAPPGFLRLGGAVYMASYPKSFLGEIWLSSETGEVYPGWPVFVSGIAFGAPLVFTAGTEPNVAFITQAGALSVYDKNGGLLPGFPADIPGVFYVQPVFDGQFLWTVSGDGILYRISLDGTILFQQIPGFSVGEGGSIIAADTDGDKVPEIFVTGDGNLLYGFSRNFISLEGFPLPVWGRPFFGDLNGDRKIECSGVGLDNKLYRWQFK